MEVILREDIERLGNRGQVVKVADGYARNFLLPKRLAVAATDANRKIVEQERQAHLRREAKQKGEAEDLSKLLSGVTVTIAQKAGENDQLFGSVTSKDVADALAAEELHYRPPQGADGRADQAAWGVQGACAVA
jgi:large subunit ribosomal protein L9